jgi:inward rectifier potassium channel
MRQFSVVSCQCNCYVTMRDMAEQPPPQDPNLDLGFGSIVARDSRKRLLNRNGTFNVRREGLGFLESLSAYHHLLTITWRRFLTYIVAAYVLVNIIFALLYVACGPSTLSGLTGTGMYDRFVQAFFFSVDTVATIGYGNIVPATFMANVLVTIESLVGLLGFSVVAGIVFARFARPVARIVFSSRAVIAPYRNITAFMFRVVNQKSNEIVEMQAKVMVARRRRDGSAAERDFSPLTLERDRVTFFPLTWTVVHPIDENSPLWGLSAEDLQKADAEFLILLNGFDETFSQNVHTRSSYKADEVVWGAKFSSVFNPPRPDGTISVDIGKVHDVERVALETGATRS